MIAGQVGDDFTLEPDEGPPQTQLVEVDPLALIKPGTPTQDEVAER